MKMYRFRNRHAVANVILSSASILFIALLLSSSALWSQSVIHNERILAPEVSHFVRLDDPGVDAHGDLSLSIPLMMVPGRDGLNFDLVANYRSGIQVKQSASWIGLGWSLDVGSITRHPMAGLDYKHFISNIAEQVDWDYVHTTQLRAQPDVYMANMNGSSTFLLSTTLLSVGSPYRPYEPAQALFLQNKLRLVPAPWKPWVISTANGVVTQDGFQTATSQDNAQSWVARSDISKIVITTEDGTRYVYSLPTLSEGYFPKENVLNFEYVRYVTTWRLVSILSPNYAGPDTVDATSTGGWMKISYRSWKTLPNYRKVDTIYNNPNLLAQITYPWKIETPTHYAEFTISKRYDRDLKVDVYNYNKKLDKISLYKKIINEGDNLQLIKEVFFHYKPNGAPDSLASSNPAIKFMLSKLTLDSLKIKGYDASATKIIPAYKFSYNDTDLGWPEISIPPDILLNYQDDFGYFWDNRYVPSDPIHNNDGPVFSLKEIVYPDGGRHAIMYENDVLSSTSLSYRKYNYPSPGQDPQFNATYTANVSGTFARLNQGGARVKRLKKYDGFNTSGDSVTFAYGNGYHSGIPETWFRKSSELTGVPLYSSGDRGEFNVTYAWIEKTFVDNSKIKSFYKAGDGPETQMIYKRGNIATVILYGNTRWYWGEADSVQYFAAGSGNPVKVERFHYSSNTGIFARVAPALAHTGGTTPQIDLLFTHQQLDSLVTKHYFGSNIVTSRESHIYNDGALLEKTTETSADGKIRTTENIFIHDIAGLAVADSMKNRNMRSQIAQTSIKQNNDNTKGYASTVTRWKIVTHNGKNKFLPDKEHHWRNKATSVTIPSFNWSNPDTAIWIRTQTFLGYDAHGNPTRIHDAYGSETTISWDVASGTLIDSIKTRPNTSLKPLTTKYGYDLATFRLISITDPNNQKTEYKYDPLQRLIEMITPDKRTVAQHGYLYSRQAPGSNDNFVTTNPNHLRSIASSHAEHVRNHDFETGSASPDFWTLTTNGSGVLGTWETTGYAGVRSVSAQITTAGSNKWVRWKNSTEEKVSPQKKYRMEVWVKTDASYPNSVATFKLEFHNASHATIVQTVTLNLPNTTVWKKCMLDFITVSTADHLHAATLDFTPSSTQTGKIWYDRANFYELNIAKIFADGLGRDIQAMQYEGNNGAIKAGTIYDFASRVSKVAKPFSATDTSFVLDPISAANTWYSQTAGNHPAYYFSAASKEYDTDPYAFAETEYYPDPLNRVNNQYFPGAAFSKNGPDKKYVKNFYTTNAANELGFAANKVLETRIVDENGVLTEIFTDTFGNKAGVRVDSAAAPADSTKLATLLQYDILNNLTKIVPPKAFQSNGNTPSLNSPLCTNMTYNTLGQLTSRQTPDAGTDSSYYDKKGNPRFFKDAKGHAGNYFIYYKYDNLSRKIEEGTMPVGSPTRFKQSKADSAAFPIGGHTMKVKFQYDSTTYAANGTQRNLRGRLDAIEYVDDRFPLQKGYIFYSYDSNGNVEWINQYIPTGNNNHLATRTDYQYDALSKVTKIYFRRVFPPGAATDAFYVWYDYDALGRLERVLTNTTDVKPLVPSNAQYSYWPSGQVKRLVLGNSVQGVDYLYNSRDWLTQINSHFLLANKDPGSDSTTVTKDRFGEIIGYNTQKYIASDADYTADFAAQFNGNISWATFNTFGNSNPASLTGWVFKYDKANRLTKGNWGYNSNVLGTNWSAANNYDLTGITYDRNGNLKTMTRRSQSGIDTAMTYNYIDNTNKLRQVTSILPNQGANNYVYDANGNMIKNIAKLGDNTISYDYRNLPTQVPKTTNPAGTIYFGYDGTGQRVSKNNLFYVPGADGRVLAVYDDKGTLLYWNIWGLDLIGQRFWKQ